MYQKYFLILVLEINVLLSIYTSLEASSRSKPQESKNDKNLHPMLRHIFVTNQEKLHHMLCHSSCFLQKKLAGGGVPPYNKIATKDRRPAQISTDEFNQISSYRDPKPRTDGRTN